MTSESEMMRMAEKVKEEMKKALEPKEEMKKVVEEKVEQVARRSQMPIEMPGALPT
ncbi:hypothetical protein GNI_084670, partial [Gregarina niphandrodes]